MSSATVVAEMNGATIITAITCAIIVANVVGVTFVASLFRVPVDSGLVMLSDLYNAIVL